LKDDDKWRDAIKDMKYPHLLAEASVKIKNTKALKLIFEKFKVDFEKVI
jgi:hypothetical protein